MRKGLSNIACLLFLVLCLPPGFLRVNAQESRQPGLIPTITGPSGICVGTAGNVYSTEPWQINYVWSIPPGGIITAGGTATENFVTVTWNSVGTHTVSVTYNAASTPGTKDVDVYAANPVSVVIVPSENPVCAGSAVTFNASVTNGGSTPVYNWFVNSVNVGNNSPVYSYTPANNDIVYCQVTSDLICASGNPASSAPVTVLVTANFPVSVSVLASANPSCEGVEVTYTATPFNGGNSPQYQWKIDGTDVPSATNSTFTYLPLTGNVVTCLLNSSMTCISGNPALSSPLVMTVSQNQPVSVSVTASANPVCVGTQVVYTALPVNGGTMPAYSWLVNGTSIGGPGGIFVYTPADGEVVSCVLNSNAVCKTGNPATSNSLLMSVNNYEQVGVAIVASENPVCAGMPVTLTAIPTNGGAMPGYQWKVNSTVLVHNSPVYTYFPSNGDVITCDLSSSLQCTSNNPATSNPVIMSVSQTLIASLSITASSNPSCAGTPILFTAHPENGGLNPQFEWYVNGDISGTGPAFTHVPVMGDVVNCQMISSALCSQGGGVISNSITMNISPTLPAQVSISPSLNPVCEGSQVTLSATPVNGGLAPVYQWIVNGSQVGGSSPTLTYTPLNNDLVHCVMTSSLTCAVNNPVQSAAVTMLVSSALPVGISIAVDKNPACVGEQVNFTATATNGGTSPLFTWLVNNVGSGSNQSTFSYIPTSGDTVSCYLNSSYSCATGNPGLSNKIGMTMSPSLPVGITISTPNDTSCQGSMVTYTAVAVNGGSSPYYQWRVNGNNMGTNSSSFTYLPVHNDVITCELTSSVTCPVSNPVISNAIIQVVLPMVTAAISISASANPVCTGTEVTFTSNAVNGGPSPVYQWKLNGNNAGTGPVLIFTPNNGNTVSCKLTSSLMCVNGSPVTSNQITMTVNSSIAPSVSISASANPFCQGATVNFSSSATNGGTSPVYSWLVNGNPVGSGNSYSYQPQDGDFVICRLTSGLMCASPAVANSNPILMNQLNNLPVSVSISIANNPVCEGSAAVFSASVSNGGSNPVYQWKVNGINQGVNSPAFSYVPSGTGDQVVCLVTSNALCASGNPASSNIITVLTTNSLTGEVVISTNTNPFCEGTSVIFRATPMNGGGSPAFQWKVNSVNQGNNSATFSYFPQNGDAVTCAMTSSAACITGSNPVISLPIVMVSSTTLPVAISIVATNSNPCEGDVVNFMATPVNGGESPDYQWKVNGNGSGSNQSVFSYAPDDQDKVTCEVFSSLICATGNPANSNEITMNVAQAQAASVTITASENPVCQGSLVTFTAHPVNGGISPVFKWRVNGSIVGGNTPTYTYQPQNNDAVTVTMTTSEFCITNSPAVSNSVSIVVKPEQPVQVTIQTSTLVSFFCPGEQVVYEATVSNGGTTPVYQWFVNGLPAGTNNFMFLYSPLDGDQISCMVTSNQSCITNNPANSNVITMVASAAIPVSVTITTASGNSTICAGSAVQYTATEVNGGSSPSYQWKVNGVNIGPNHHIFVYTPQNGDVVVCVVTSNLSCASGNPATSNAIVMNVLPSAPVSIAISASCNPCCVGTTVTYTAVAVNPGPDPVYRWRINGSNIQISGSPVFTYTPVNNDVVYCRMSSNQLCATNNPANSNSITMIMQPYGTVSVAITASANPVCAGSQVTYTATAVNGGSSPEFQWKVNNVVSGTNSPLFTYTPANGDQVTCKVVSNASCIFSNTANSNTLTMTVSPLLPVSVIIAPSSNPVCEGNVTFNATPSNGGPLPVYQWKVNGVSSGTNNPVFNYAPSDGDAVTCILTSTAACATGNPAISNSVVLSVVQSSPVSVSIAASSQPPCQGQSITFSAAAVNEGTVPVYQWLTNGIFVGTNSPLYTYVPNNGDVVQCLLTSSITCPTGNPALSNSLTMNFNPVLPVSISITCSANPACMGTQTQFTAITSNAGNSPVYQWKVNGVISGSNQPIFLYNPSQGDVVTCTLTADLSCPLNNPAVSNSISMVVLPPQVASLAISTQSTSVCSGSPAVFQASGQNAGSTPAYQWYVNGIATGLNSPTFVYIPQNDDVVTCEMISSVSCITNNPVASNPITMHVSSEYPVSISISPSSNPVCLGQNVTFTSVAVNGGVNPEYRWMVNGINVGSNSPVYTYTPSTGQVVTCQLVSDYSCATGSPATSNAVLMQVNTILPVEASITSSLNPACSGTPVTYNASVVNGGTSPFFQWRVNGINTMSPDPVFTYIPADGDIVTCLVTSSEACVSGNPDLSNAIMMIIRSSFAADVTITVSDNPICVNTPVTFNASPTLGGPLPSYQWKRNGIDVGANQPVYTCFPDDNDVFTCVMTSTLTCATNNPATSNTIQMIVLPIPVGVSIVSDPAAPVCSGDPVTFTAIPFNGGPGPSYQWKVNDLPVGTSSPVFVYPPADGDQVTCMLMSNATCASGSMAVSNIITASVNALLPVSISIVSDIGTNICNGSVVTYTASAINEGAGGSYQWTVNNNPSGSNAPVFLYSPSDGDIIRCQVTSVLTCASGNPAMSNEIVMVVNPVYPAGVSISADPPGAFCAGTSVTFSALPVNGGSSPVYQWFVDGSAMGGNNQVFSYQPDDGDAVTCSMTSSDACAFGSPAMSAPVIMTVNPNFPVGLQLSALPNDSVCAGIPVTVQATISNGGTSPVYQWMINGQAAGLNQPQLSFTPTVNSIVTCTLTSNLACATGNPYSGQPLVITINPTPAVTYGACHDLVTSLDALPFRLRGGSPLGGTYSGTGVNSGTGLFTPSDAGTGLQRITYSYINYGGCEAHTEFDITVNPAAAFTCGGIFTDPRDGRAYPTVDFNGQCWMGSNLNFGTLIEKAKPQNDNCVSEKYCQGDVSSGCNFSGGLYQWDELMRHEATVGLQDICPPGWHVPAEAEWQSLFAFLGGQSHAGELMKESGPGAFNAETGGVIYQNNLLALNNGGLTGTFFWASTPSGTLYARSHGLNNQVGSVSDYLSLKSNAFSVRCVKN